MSDAPSAQTEPHFLVFADAPPDRPEGIDIRPVVQGPDYTGEVRIASRDSRGVDEWAVIVPYYDARHAWHLLGLCAHPNMQPSSIFGGAYFGPIRLDRLGWGDRECGAVFAELGHVLERIKANLDAAMLEG